MKLTVFAVLVFTLFAGTVAFAQTAAEDVTIRNEVVRNEQELMRAEKQHDNRPFKSLLDDGLIYVAFNGWVFTKSDLVSKLDYIDVNRFHAANFKIRVPAKDVALVTYDLDASANIAGIGLPNKEYTSSVWVRRAGNWKLLFHQSTPATHP